MKKNKSSVFILLGQSNAVGHGIPMKPKDYIQKPLKNVFGLSRKFNQSFSNTNLYWSGYTSFDMNLAEEQDNTYSLSNCLASLWQKEINSNNKHSLPNLYIIQIAIGAQGVTEKFMWNPKRTQKLIPGKLSEVNISLFPFTKHIFSLLDESFKNKGEDYEIIGIHWRGGEEDITASRFELANLKSIYEEIFEEFSNQLNSPPIILHKLLCFDRAKDLDPKGDFLNNLHYVNKVFNSLASEHKNICIFDVSKAPYYKSNIRTNGIYIEDAVHYTPEINKWVANEILKNYCNKK